MTDRFPFSMYITALCVGIAGRPAAATDQMGERKKDQAQWQQPAGGAVLSVIPDQYQ